MRFLLASAVLGVLAISEIGALGIGPAERPIELAQAHLPPGSGTPPGFKPPPSGDRPTLNGNRPTTGEPNLPGPTNVPPRTNGQPSQEKRLNPTGDPDVQRGIDEHRRKMGR